MDLNADFAQRAAVHAARLDWAPSPMPGVERRLLDRVGDEVARATSIVRYAPGSRFSPHTHDAGEEFLVLEGVFQDEHGDFPVGTYVRNPPASRHRPGSAAGCTIFVKLRQFDPNDRKPVRLDIADLPPRATGEPGVEAATLFAHDEEQVRLERWAPNATITRNLPGGLELLVLSGTLIERGETFEPHCWLRLPAGAAFHAQAGASGCRFWSKTGHLRHPRGLAA